MRISKAPEERRQEIIDASKELFLQRGFAKTRIGDIAEHLGIAKGLFYYYFHNKDEVMGAIIDDYIQAMVNAVREIAAKDIDYREKLSGIVFAIIDCAEETQHVFSDLSLNDHSLLHQSVLEHTLERLEEVLDEVVDDGVKHGVIHSKNPHTLIKILFYGLGMMDFSSMDRNTILEMVAHVMGIR